MVQLFMSNLAQVLFKQFKEKTSLQFEAPIVYQTSDAGQTLAIQTSELCL